MAECAEEIYLQIMKMIKLKEKTLNKNQALRVKLLEYPDFEVIGIGRLGNRYLIFSGAPSETCATTLLLPAESVPIALNVINLGEKTRSAELRRQIEFWEDVSDIE